MQISKKRFWSGVIISAFVFLFLLGDSITHMLGIPAVTTAFAQLGFPVSVAFPLGIIELICLIIYAIPETTIVGAILLTGYLGGAVAANVRVTNPLFTLTLTPVYLGILLWLGLYLLDGRLGSFRPFRKRNKEAL